MVAVIDKQLRGLGKSYLLQVPATFGNVVSSESYSATYVFGTFQKVVLILTSYLFQLRIFIISYNLLQNGHVTCRRTACSSDKECYFLPYNEKRGCCNLCKGCYLNGKLHESETEWIDNSDPCRTYSCQSGILTDARLHCHVPCRNPQPPRPGECCSSCKGCSIGGRTYQDGEELEATKADACVQCRCQKGNIVCFKKACPVLPCPSIRYVQRPGDCCPRCRGMFKTLVTDVYII
ncbi:BMP-binding endothelial regulator protein-like [Tachypleus tridentatus]|uniref:BMP-binding endothelial regulator protein-like n=1 Tax=Tachypleus tridentatus TaxID=6853 RepID=UPI003FD0272B